MTLSNFNWTDKQTVKWFIMMPTGHEGPYSLETLTQRFAQGKISKKTQIWAEGLPGFVAAEEALFPKAAPVEAPASKEVAVHSPNPKFVVEPDLNEEVVPEVEEDDELPPLPMEESPGDIPVAKTARKKWWKKASFLISLVSLVLFLLGWQFFKAREVFSIHRPARMSPDLYQRVMGDFQFESWDKDIFFKEYLSTDLSHVWLVTGSFQKCDVEASFHSIPGKLLSLAEDKVSMRSKGKLQGHIVEFSVFDFVSGNKIIPGLYEMDVKASGCEWDGLMPKIGNLTTPPDETYVGRTKVVLFPKGAQDFYRILEKLTKKKQEIAQKTESAEELFWQDLQQKFQTLLAITLQIEQHFLDFIDKDARQFSKNLKPMVDAYTRKFGSVLTNFVVSNENYFKELHEEDYKNFGLKKTYEPKVRLSSKNIGFESMKIIENFQSLKHPRRVKLNEIEVEVKSVFKKLKENLNQTIIQVSEDRSR